jgi:integrase
MSVYKPKGSPFWHFDFQTGGSRFHGSTKRTNRRQAEAIERAEREKARDRLRQAAAGPEALTLDVAAGRYWTEVGQHHANADTTWTNIERLIAHLGRHKLLVDIRDNDIAELVAWRRGHRVRGRIETNTGKEVRRVSAATVNRSTTQLLQAIFTRAKRSWGVRFDHEPQWRHHRLAEPQERVRELHDDEATRLDAVIRADLMPYFDFVRASGQRLAECLLRWPEVNWATGQIIKTGKRGRRIVVPITPVIREILWPLRGHDPEFVFTYVARRTRGGRVKGRRYPLTYNGVKTAWKRIRKAAELSDFRFHDFRHDLATKVLRETGNLKLVQKVLNHADINTTTKYAHVLTEEVAEALDRVQKSRKTSRTRLREAG